MLSNEMPNEFKVFFFVGIICLQAIVLVGRENNGARKIQIILHLPAQTIRSIIM